ncbi:MAG TPA: bifunctional histidinol-phosphatase/imidazoleglycerol-phosphate dehydratase HisB [Cyclobacteriaceae bacterium]|nr:bifunctional histidinol-phosphatase/imidazoleglycerol-phosphate dehydratase HisB [Cyclobacteriaceae bacterium]
MNKIIFLDRDGTIIEEPDSDYQVDSLEKLILKPYVISSLRDIIQFTGYQLVMVTNQDGLGTPSFPEDTFWPAHNKLLDILKNEGVEFLDVHIDRHFASDNSPNRKPGIGMLTKYLNGEYDIKNSIVIGDRATDLELAGNLGAQAIFYSDKEDDRAVLCTTSWTKIRDFLVKKPRKNGIERKTSETQISVELNLDGSGISAIKTGLGFFDHMLEQISRHGSFDLSISSKGDLQVDEHHTVEDTGIALGMAFSKCLENKRGIGRYGFVLPMDDSLAQVSIDFGGRPWLVWNAEFKREKVGDLPTELFHHFFKSFADNAKCNLNIKAEGDNEHHKIESIFKAFARTLKMAVRIDPGEMGNLPSTKGLI